MPDITLEWVNDSLIATVGEEQFVWAPDSGLLMNSESHEEAETAATQAVSIILQAREIITREPEPEPTPESTPEPASTEVAPEPEPIS